MCILYIKQISSKCNLQTSSKFSSSSSLSTLNKYGLKVLLDRNPEDRDAFPDPTADSTVSLFRKGLLLSSALVKARQQIMRLKFAYALGCIIYNKQMINSDKKKTNYIATYQKYNKIEYPSRRRTNSCS